MRGAPAAGDRGTRARVHPASTNRLHRRSSFRPEKTLGSQSDPSVPRADTHRTDSSRARRRTPPPRPAFTSWRQSPLSDTSRADAVTQHAARAPPGSQNGRAVGVAPCGEKRALVRVAVAVGMQKGGLERSSSSPWPSEKPLRVHTASPSPSLPLTFPRPPPRAPGVAGRPLCRPERASPKVARLRKPQRGLWLFTTPFPAACSLWSGRG